MFHKSKPVAALAGISCGDGGAHLRQICGTAKWDVGRRSGALHHVCQARPLQTMTDRLMRTQVIEEVALKPTLCLEGVRSFSGRNRDDSYLGDDA